MCWLLNNLPGTVAGPAVVEHALASVPGTECWPFDAVHAANGQLPPAAA